MADTTDAKNKKAIEAQTKVRLNVMDVLRAFPTVDGFDNFLSKIGLNNKNTLSAGTYEFNLVTRNRILIEAAYRGSWVVGMMVDAVAEDMTRAGVEITTSKQKDLRQIYRDFTTLQIWPSLCNVIKWGRLYGGSLGVLQIEGQDMSTPLRLETIKKGQFKGIVPFDRWTLNPMLFDPIEFGPNMGLPSQYQIVNDPREMEPKYQPGVYQNGLQTVHYSRCVRFVGIELPYFQAITEMMWGESVLERAYDRLIAFDNATMSSASLVDRANLRTVGIENFREIVSAGGPALQGLTAMFEMMREMQVNEGLTLLDKNDTFAATAYSFSGLSEMMLQFGQQIAGATGTPLVRLFGQSPAGLNSTGEADLRMYYDNINAQQEARLRNPMDTILNVAWRSTYGQPPPDDMEFSFKPLWQQTPADKANNAKTTAETILGAFNDGVTDKATTLKALRDNPGMSGLFADITDEQITEAELEPPPMPDEDPEESEGKGDPPKKEPVKNLDSSYKSRFKKWFGKS